LGGAFYGCTSLTAITNLAPTPQNILSSVFEYVNLSNITLYVPFGSLEAYQNAAVWQNFGTLIETLPNPHWQANYQPYPSSMTFTSTVVFNYTELQSNGIEIGAFSDGECRGSTLLQYFPESIDHPYLGFLTVHGNDNDIITFWVYDHATGIEYKAENLPSVFVADNIQGTPSNPYPLTVTTLDIKLNEGWTWFSVNRTNDSLSMLDQFKAEIGNTGVLLKGRNEFIQAPEWIGSLSEITSQGMYMVNTTAEQTVSFRGAYVDPAQVPVPLSNGWNWIGYTPYHSLPVSAAFAGINPQVNDEVKSYSSYSIYTSQGWVGNLEQMMPGNGYKYHSNSAVTQILTYPQSMQSASPTYYSAKETPATQWTANAYTYPNTMTLTSIVIENGRELDNDQLEIGAFSGNECRGSILLRNFPQITNHPCLGFLVIYGEGNEEIHLRLYDHATGKEYAVMGAPLPFVVDAIHGNPANPYRITTLQTGINDVAVNASNIYLKQVDGLLQIQYPWEMMDYIDLLDLNGRSILRKTGFTARAIDISSLSKGVYILKLAKNDQLFVKRFIKN
jgi:hypothetical protein